MSGMGVALKVHDSVLDGSRLLFHVRTADALVALREVAIQWRWEAGPAKVGGVRLRLFFRVCMEFELKLDTKALYPSQVLVFKFQH